MPIIRNLKLIACTILIRFLCHVQVATPLRIEEGRQVSVLGSAVALLAEGGLHTSSVHAMNFTTKLVVTTL